MYVVNEPCPFCGDKGVLIDRGNPVRHRPRVKCFNPGCEFQTPRCNSEIHALQTWHTLHNIITSYKEFNNVEE